MAAALSKTIVLVPGLLTTADVFAPQIAVLSKTARIVVADVGRHDSIEGMAAGVLDTVEGDFAIGGLSMGGFVALEVARRAPDRVDGIALIDTSARADRPEQKPFWEKQMALARSDGPAAVSRALLPVLVHPDRLKDKTLLATLEKMATQTGAEACVRQQAAISGRADYRDLLPQISCPATVICGAEDKMTPVRLSEEMAAALPEAQIAIIPQCGHLTTLERPEAVTHALVEWMKRLA